VKPDFFAKEASHKTCNAVADAFKKNLKGQYKVFNEDLRRKMNQSSIFPTFKKTVNMLEIL
jgi:hypothetical protein